MYVKKNTTGILSIYFLNVEVSELDCVCVTRRFIEDDRSRLFNSEVPCMGMTNDHEFLDSD